MKRETHIYSKTGTSELAFDLYNHTPTSEARPVVVWLHGGAWRRGSRDNVRHCDELMRAGYVLASVSYRFSQEARFPAQIIDCKAAVRWLRAHATEYGLDTEQIFAWGASAGGHLAALLGAPIGELPEAVKATTPLTSMTKRRRS
jgi:acetyl esterase/lipase